MVLDERLSAIAGYIRKGTKVADIGCDHAKLLCALAKNNHITHGVACDIHRGPLNSALKNARMNGVESFFEFRLGDGLKAIDADEADDIVIAGMGGETIATIISECPWRITKEKNLILQPMTRAHLLRAHLFNNGYTIKSEKACKSKGRFYTVMQVFYSGEFMCTDDFNPFCYIGKLDVKSDPFASLFLAKTVSTLSAQQAWLAHTDPFKAQKLLKLIHALKIYT
jgi:tRNA (adenine22-N1)-methyltransferase